MWSYPDGGGGTAESTTATSVQITTPFTVPPPGLEHTPTTVAAALMDTPTFDCQGVSSWAEKLSTLLHKDFAAANADFRRAFTLVQRIASLEAGSEDEQGCMLEARKLFESAANKASDAMSMLAKVEDKLACTELFICAKIGQLADGNNTTSPVLQTQIGTALERLLMDPTVAAVYNQELKPGMFELAKTGRARRGLLGQIQQLVLRSGREGGVPACALPSVVHVNKGTAVSIGFVIPKTAGHIMRGHSFDVSCVAALADDRVVRGSGDKTLRVWTVPDTPDDNVQSTHTLKGHTSNVNCVATFANGRVVSGSSDMTLRVWTVGGTPNNDVKPTHILRVHAQVPPSKVCACSECDAPLEQDAKFCTECGESISSEALPSDVWCVATIGDSQVVSGHLDGVLHVWTLPLLGTEPDERGNIVQPTHFLKGHASCVNCVATMADGRVVSGSSDMTLRVWAVPDGPDDNVQATHVLSGHTSDVYCVAPFSDGRVVSGSNAGMLRVWTVPDEPSDGTVKSTHILKGHTSCASCVVTLADGRVVSGSDDTQIRVWTVPDTPDDNVQPTHAIKGHSGCVSCVATLGFGQVLTGSADRTIRIWSQCTE
eukprot:gene10663-6508_t